jgi:integrase/recombinase XerD
MSRLDARRNRRVSLSNRLPSFFLYAEQRCWVRTAIAHDIHGPRVPRFAAAAQWPAWKDVRLLLELNDEGSAHPLRSTAMLFLLSPNLQVPLRVCDSEASTPPSRHAKHLKYGLRTNEDAGSAIERTGPHSLRHSCATQLLHKGMSLPEIADFLGHRDLRSVSIYAKLDARALRKVADFPLMETP